MVNDCGNVVATEEVPEGSQVAVIAMPCHPLWKTDKGIKAGCPANFGCPDGCPQESMGNILRFPQFQQMSDRFLNDQTNFQGSTQIF